MSDFLFFKFFSSDSIITKINSNKTAFVFDAELTTITKKYLEVGYQILFKRSVINDIKIRDEKQPIIHECLFK